MAIAHLAEEENMEAATWQEDLWNSLNSQDVILLSAVLRNKGIEILSKLEIGDLYRSRNTGLSRLLRLSKMDGTSWR
ncbi:hypothetical protein PMIT1306_00621 [Prochlorococcus sp. MIT 1306]|nr:hypothetical protein PMIT1306_00621 [Prochlorococcus sp. MIT 1306]